MDDTRERIEARQAGIGRLNTLTAWIGVGALAAAAALAAVAGATIPGKATQDPGGTGGVSSAPQPSPRPADVSLRHHRRSSDVSSSPGPGMVVTGGSH